MMSSVLKKADKLNLSLSPLGLNNLNIIWILDPIKEMLPKYKAIHNDSGEQH